MYFKLTDLNLKCMISRLTRNLKYMIKSVSCSRKTALFTKTNPVPANVEKMQNFYSGYTPLQQVNFVVLGSIATMHHMHVLCS